MRLRSVMSRRIPTPCHRSLSLTDARESSIELRVLLSARDSGALFELRCEVREGLIAFLQREYPDALPRQRQEVVGPRPSP